MVNLWDGLADREANRPWRRNTIMPVASTTKGATAICAHLLVQRGLLNLPANRSFTMSLGFWRACPPYPMLSPASLGHPGSGGSVGFGDPDAEVGFGYATHLWNFRPDDPRATDLAAAVRVCLG